MTRDDVSLFGEDSAGPRTIRPCTLADLRAWPTTSAAVAVHGNCTLSSDAATDVAREDSESPDEPPFADVHENRDLLRNSAMFIP